MDCEITSILVFNSVQFSRSVMCNSLRPHGLQHARLPCPLPSLRVFSNSCPLSQWCHPTKFLWQIPNLQYLRMWPCLEIGSLQRSSVRVMPLGWVLIQNDWRSYKKWQFGHRDMSRRKTMWREIQGECHVNMKTAIHKLERGREQISPAWPPGRIPCTTLISDFHLHISQTIYFCCLRHPVCGTFTGIQANWGQQCLPQ